MNFGRIMKMKRKNRKLHQEKNNKLFPCLSFVCLFVYFVLINISFVLFQMSLTSFNNRIIELEKSVKRSKVRSIRKLTRQIEFERKK